MFKDINDLMEHVAGKKQQKTVAVAAAADEHTLEAVCRAEKDGYVKPLLIGDKKEILRILKEIGESVDEDRIYDVTGDGEIAKMAVRLVREGKADFIMKGLLNTSDVLKAVLNKQEGLKHGGLLTVMAMLEVPGYHKLLAINDAAVIPYPNLESKKEQIKMVTGAMHKMGYDDNLKVAAVCANENVNPKITETLEASQLKKMNQEGKITGCIVEGPISIDLALRPEIAKAKKYESPVAGDADLLLFPTLVSANCYSKAVEMTGARAVSFVLGAQVPIALTSRATTAENKYCTVVLASAMVGGL